MLILYYIQIGTYQIAMVAKACNKPVYIAVESYKFARLYPMNQRDLKHICETAADVSKGVGSDVSKGVGSGVSKASGDDDVSEYSNMSIDFTPAEYITLLFTDLGVLTPAAVSEELIKLYQ